MAIIASNPISQALGSRIRGMNAWQRQQELHATQRLERLEGTRNTPRENLLYEIARTNPNTMPASEPRLNPSTEISGPSILMPPHHRNIVMARAALANGVNEGIFFNNR